MQLKLIHSIFKDRILINLFYQRSYSWANGQENKEYKDLLNTKE